MKTNQFVVAQVFLLLCASALATEYFVDANHGNDGWDGTSSNYVSGVIGPKKTLQAAADLIPNNDGHIITVLPGVYNEGGAVYPGDGFSLTNRLAISRKNVTIRSTGGKEVTHIVGAIDSEYADGCGPAAVRCVRGPGSDNGTVLIGFTLRDGHNGITSTKNEDRGGGAFDVYLYDCTISNCVSHTRGGAGNNSTLVRCRIIGNTAGSHGMACNSCSLANCLVARNYGSGATLTYTLKMVNTSVVGNTGGPALSLGPSGTTVWNCFFAGNHEGQNGFDSAGNATGAHCINTVCELQSFFEYVDETSVTNALLGQCVSSALGDAHLVPWSVALNCADATYLEEIQLPTGYEQMDLDGNQLQDSGAIHCGCFQQTVTPTGAKLSFNSEFTWDVGEPIPVNKNATHYFTNPTETLKVKPILASDKTMYGLYSASENESNGKNNFRIPMMDGYVRIFANPDPNFVISLNVQVVTRKYYCDAKSGNDDWDGTSATFVSGTTGPKKTLAGVCAVADLKNYNLVYVAPGVYDDGTCDGTVPSRLKVTRPVGFISSGGIGTATIKGGSQVRCAYLGSGNAFLQGFVLADGSSTADSGEEHRGAAVFASTMTPKILDCTITNCTAKYVVLYRGTLQRSQVVDCTVQDGPLTYITTCAASIFAGNRFGNEESADNCIFFERSAAYGCTVDAGRKRVYVANATGAIGNIVVGRTAGDDNPAANYSDNVENVNPMFVSRAHRDFRLGEQSPALGAVDPASFASTNASFFLTTDYYGNPLRAVNGRLTAGAVHNEPLPPIKGFVLVVR